MTQHSGNKSAENNGAATIADVDAAIDELAQATKQSFDSVEQRFNQIDQRLDKMDERLDKIDQRLESLDRSQSAILDVLKSIDEHYRTMRDIPERVQRLEDAVFRR